jgi:hypothetical protein
MSANAHISNLMKLNVRLRRGRIAREVTVTITVSAAQWDPLAISRAIGEFACGVDVGLFGEDQGPVRTTAMRERHQGACSVATLEAAFPGMPPNAFAVLARMVAATVPGARRFEIVEHAPEPALVVRKLEDDADATIADVPWRIAFSRTEAPLVRVRFDERVTEETALRAIGTLEAWVRVVSLGGFHGPPAKGACEAELRHVGCAGPQEIVARFERLSTAHEAFEALFQGLLVIHEAAPIAAVEIACQPVPGSRASATKEDRRSEQSF